MSSFKDQFIGVSGVVSVFVLILYLSKRDDVFLQIRQDFTSIPLWIILFITLAIIYVGLKDKDEDMRTSIHHAIIALVASYFSHLNLIFPAFYIVLVVEYFSKKYIS